MTHHHDHAHRWLRLEVGDDSHALHATGFRGREAISELYRFTITFLIKKSEDVPFDKILAQPLRLHLDVPGAPERTIRGIASALRETDSDSNFTYYETDLVPDVWLLTKTIRSRVFQQMTVPEILAKVLAGYSVDSSGLRLSYPVHNYCVQYQESDFAFAARIMEEEGIHFFFREHDGRTILALSDRSLLNPALPTSSELRFDPVAGGHRKAAQKGRIIRWRKNQTVESGKYCVWDDQFQMPNHPLEAATAIVDEVTVGSVRHKLLFSANRDLEIYDHDPGFAQRFDAVGPTGNDRHADLSNLFNDNMRTAKIYMESEASSSLWIDGESHCANLTSGHSFDLTDHGGANGKYLTVSVEHELSGVTYRSHDEGEQRYGNDFVCQPLDLPYRPRAKTPTPRAYPQTAVVTGVDGEEIFTDAHGRVKVQFYWDREGKRDAHSSCWVRVLQPWAGSGFGHISLPRIGQEVMVDFVNGDPDAPFVLGSVHNPDQVPPRPLPSSRTQTVFKSHTKFGDSNSFNGFGMDDTPSAEHMQLNSQKNFTFASKDTAYHNYNTNNHEIIGQRHTRRVGGLPGINYGQTTGAPPGGGGQGPDRSTESTIKSESTAPVGSGSGGESPYSSSGTNTGPFSWSSSVMGDWAEALDIILGRKQEAVVGAWSELCIGWKTNTVLNPIGLAAAFGAGSSTALTVTPWSVIAGVPVAGNVAAVIGTSSTAIYGPSFKVTRGHNMDLKLALEKPNTWKDFQTAAYIMAGLYCTYRIGEQFLNLIQPTALTGNVVGFVGSFVELEMINAWYSLEIKNQMVKKWQDSTKKSLGEVTAQLTKLKTEIAEQNEFYDDVLAGICDELELTGTGSGEGGSMVADSVTEDITGVANFEVCDSMYCVNAPGISLISTPDPDDECAILQLSSYGGEDIDGIISIYSSFDTTIFGGDMAMISLQSPGEVDGIITIDCGADGQIFLQNGVEKLPNLIMLCAEEGIVVESLLSYTIDVDEQIFEMDPEIGILMSSFGENNLLMTEAGIILEVGPSSIMITDEGIVIDAPTISILGDTEVTIDALDITLDALDVMIDVLGLTIDALETTIL